LIKGNATESPKERLVGFSSFPRDLLRRQRERRGEEGVGGGGRLLQRVPNMALCMKTAFSRPLPSSCITVQRIEEVIEGGREVGGRLEEQLFPFRVFGVMNTTRGVELDEERRFLHTAEWLFAQ